MITRIKTLSKQEMCLNRPFIVKAKNVIVVSMIDPDAAAVFDVENENIITVRFNDITPGPWWANAISMDSYKFCNSHDARKIVRHILKWANRQKEVQLFINCSAGINRSGAVARYALKHSEVTDAEFWNDNPQIKNNDWVFWKLIEAENEIGDK